MTDFEIPEGPDSEPENESGDSAASTTETETNTDVTDEAAPDASESTTVGDGTQPAASIGNRTIPSETPTLTDGEVGHVLGSNNIRIGRTDHQVEAYITTKRREDVQVGDYVQIPYPAGEDSLFAAVDALRYEPYTDLDDTTDTHNRIVKNQSVDESEYVLVAELDPIATIASDESATDPEGKYNRGIVSRIPKPDATVTLTEDEAFLRTGLNIPHSGVFCGYLAVAGEQKTVNGNPLPYYISNPGSVPNESGGYDVESGEPAIWRHTLVAGSTGKGKTHFTKNLLRQFIGGKRYPVGDSHKELGVVILDPANEYWQMRENNPTLESGGEMAEYAKRLRNRESLNVGGLGEDLRVFVPQVRNTQSPESGVRTPFSVPFSLVAERPQLLMPYDASPVTRGALEDCLSDYFDDFERADENDEYDHRPPLRDASDSPPTYEGFVAFLDQNDFEESELRQRNNIASGTWRAVMRRVKRSEFEGVFDADANRLDEYSHQMFKPGQVTVIPTRHLTRAREDLVVLSVLSYIIENKLKNNDADQNVSETPLLVGIDEAHNYLSSPSGGDVRSQYIVQQARDAVRQGRKDQLGLMMITQNPEDIDDDILKQTNTNVFLGLREEVVQKVPSVPGEFARDIPKFGKGQAAVKAPDVEAVEVVGLSECLTQHGD
jgi:DNA helicase HerA-like ATPase